MDPEQVRARTRQVVERHLDRGDVTGWLEALYAMADGDAGKVPWADLVANPHLVAWAERGAVGDDGGRALVIGCGLGDDAEYLVSLGFDVVGFDVAPTAIEWCRRRFGQSRVDYRVADLLAMPGEWNGAFDLVVEIYTLQSLPVEVQPEAMRCIAGSVRAAGTLLVICRGRDDDADRGQIPWPLSKADLARFGDFGLREMSFDDYMDDEDPPVRRFRVVYRA